MDYKDYKFRRVTANDEIPVIDIFNYYIENTSAAFLDRKLSYDSFRPLVGLSKGYPFYVIEHRVKGVIGFGFMGRYHPSEVFNRVAEVTYFILPAYTHKGLGTKLLNILSEKAKELGIDTLLANVNSHNHPSIKFHLSQGFKECGRFERIGEKQGTAFDVVWMQKFIML